MKRVAALPLKWGHRSRLGCSNRLHNLHQYAQTACRYYASPRVYKDRVPRQFRDLPQDSRSYVPDDEGGGQSKDEGAPFFARLVPKSRAYFTTEPAFFDKYLDIEKLGRKYGHLPKIRNLEQRRTKWLINQTGQNRMIIDILKNLDQVHPDVMPEEVAVVLDEHRRHINPRERGAKPHFVDHLGRGLGAGRRKESTAQAWAVEGTGEILVNGKTLVEAFGRIHDRESVIWPLKATHRIDKYNIWAKVSGGGTTGQAEALQLAIAKALVVHEPPLKTALRKAKVISRDPRRVERKKPNRLKARKKPAWVKR